MSAIKIDNLKKTYKSGFLKKKAFTALKGISLEIPEGEIFGFLGPNGAGKTTTILCMLNLISRDEGNLFIFDKSIDTHPDIFQDLGYVPEIPYLYENLKVYEFLTFGAKLHRIRNQELKERMEYYLKLFDLWGKKDSFIKNLSKGQKQRILLALNFFIKPKLLVLDEPFRGLDPVGFKHVREEISRLAEEGSTIFLSSHILSEIEMVCSQVAIIHHGKIIWEGNPKEISRKGEGYRVYYKMPGENQEAEKKIDSQKKLLAFLKTITEKNGELVQVLREKRLEDHFLETVRED